MDQQQIQIFSSTDGQAQLEVALNQETVWLLQEQMCELFGRVSGYTRDYKSSGITDDSGAEIKELFGAAVYDTPKLIQRMLGIGTTGQGEEITVDFFAGSCSTAAAALQQNREDRGNRRCISVQIAESPVTGSVAKKQGFTSIAEMKSI